MKLHNTRSGKLKILHVCRFYPSKYWSPIYGGIETYVYNLTKNLADLGCDVEVISSLHKNEKNRELVNQVKVERLKPLFTLFRNYSHFPVVPQLFFKLLFCRNVDIIHGHINSPLIVEMAALAAVIRRIPFVVTYQADVETLSPLMNSLYSVYKSLILRFVLKISTVIITTTRVYATQSSILKNYLAKLVYIPNGVNLPTSNAGNPSVKRRYGLEGYKVILFVGRLVDYKGVWYLIISLRYIIDKGIKAKLIIVGDGPLRDKLMMLVKNLKLDHNVIFCGSVPNAELSPFYNSCDVFVLPSISRSEGFGIVLLEAMIHGKPVVASQVGGISEIVTNGVVGYLVQPADPYALCTSISSILLSEDMARKMGSRARNFAKKFVWEEISKRVLNLYLSLRRVG